MSSVLPKGERFMERGTSIPRLVKDNGYCLTCRRLGKRCDVNIPICKTCRENNLECIQPISAHPISAYAGEEDCARKRRKTSAESDQVSWVDIGPEPDSGVPLEPAAGSEAGESKGDGSKAGGPEAEESEADEFEADEFEAEEIEVDEFDFDEFEVGESDAGESDAGESDAGESDAGESDAGESDAGESNAGESESDETETDESESESESEAETEILIPSARSPQPGSAIQLQTRQDENEENVAFGPLQSVFVRASSRRITRAQQSLLRTTLGHIGPRVLLPMGPLNDPDHDYAVYYDYQYDVDSGETITTRKRSHTLYTLETMSRTSTVYAVKNTWTEEGEAPLKARLRDFIHYMKECHLSHAPSDALPLAFLPACEPTTAETLKYYILRPINQGTSHLADINPPHPKVIGLAYSNPLVLQLIIAERVNHREVSSAMLPTGESAERFHRANIAAFESKIQSYLDGNEEDMLPLTVGSIIISLTETARLDNRGQAHNYPTAAKNILKMLTTLPHEEICKNLPDIFVEHFLHTSMFACLAADVSRAHMIPFTSPEFRTAAVDLAYSEYRGKLGGNCLPIMVFILNTFDLGMKMRPYIDDSGAPKPGPSVGHQPDHYMYFGSIYELLMAFNPVTDMSGKDFEASIIWRNAALLYLWSLLEWPLITRSQRIFHINARDTFRIALRRLADTPMDSNVNKTLCWPLIVLGCHAESKEDRELIERRLIYISTHFKVGNALETLHVLRHVWTLPMARRSPWLLHKSIQETRCWGNLDTNIFL
ncbi:hypothetical protein TrVGV298_001746 [Trichoderma virens]|nr:hypothetical protein TrVGV298_001746 [Trichoderma virens]